MKIENTFNLHILVKGWVLMRQPMCKPHKAAGPRLIPQFSRTKKCLHYKHHVDLKSTSPIWLRVFSTPFTFYKELSPTTATSTCMPLSEAVVSLSQTSIIKCPKLYLDSLWIPFAECLIQCLATIRYWLPATFRIDFKVLLLTNTAVNRLRDQPNLPSRTLPSSAAGLWTVPKNSQKKIRDEVFVTYAPVLWYTPAVGIREASLTNNQKLCSF